MGFFSGGFGGPQRQQLQKSSDRALARALSGQPTDVSEFFDTGVLQPALRNYDQEIAPRIDAAFSRVGGGSFNTRKGQTKADELGDLTARYQESLAREQGRQVSLADQRQFQAIGIPLQQQLARYNAVLGGLQTANSFLRPNTDTIVSPGLGSQLLGAAGTAAGMGLSGGFGGLGKGAAGGGLSAVPSLGPLAFSGGGIGTSTAFIPPFFGF
jgi:hypothetical protein